MVTSGEAGQLALHPTIGRGRPLAQEAIKPLQRLRAAAECAIVRQIREHVSNP
jgi:hypothetical protein